MMTKRLDTRGRPPNFVQSVYKRYQKLTLDAIQSDPMILDFRRGLSGEQQCSIRQVDSVPQSVIVAACSQVGLAGAHEGVQLNKQVSVYETEAVPGEPSNA